MGYSFGKAVQREPLLGSGLLAVLLSVMLYVLANGWLGIATGFGLPVRWMYVTAHLLAAYGMTVLLWPIASEEEDDPDDNPDRWLQVAILTICAYHLVAAVAYALSFRDILYEVTFAMWLLKTVFCSFIILDLFVADSFVRNAAAFFLFVACVAGYPTLLPDNWGICQWLLAKAATIALAVALYYDYVTEKYLL